MASQRYKDEVLGRRVEVKFYVEGRKRVQYFAGTILKVLMEKKNDAVQTEHFVKFDDEEEAWYNLDENLNDGTMRWELSAATSASNHSVVKKEEGEAKIRRDEDAINGSVVKKEEEEAVIGLEEAKLGNEEEEGRKRPVKQEIEKEPRTTKKRRTTESKVGHTRTKPEPQAKKNNAPQTMTADNATTPSASSINDGHKKSEQPFKVLLEKEKLGSITNIIKYMDKLEPDKNYFGRQVDGRGECSRTRLKLRNHARKHPDDPATSHWCQTGKWEPPNQDVLDNLMALIKTMIK